MHLFYIGIVLAALSGTIFVIGPTGLLFPDLLMKLFSGNTLTGFQVFQAATLVIGVVFVLADWPHRGHKSPKF